MPNDVDLLDPSEWFRAGRGLLTSIPGLTGQAVEVGLGELPTGWEPYCILSVRWVESSKGNAWRAISVEPKDLDRSASEGHWQYFIGSETLSPFLADDRAKAADSRMLAINGLVNLQYGRPARSFQPPSVGCVDRVYRLMDNQQIRHEHYREIYRSLIKSMRRELR